MFPSNIGIVAHIDHGKSTLTQHILNRFGILIGIKDIDNLSVEQERGITVRSQYYCLQETPHKINLIDTPGHVDFKQQVIKFLSCLNLILLLVDAREGIKAQTSVYYNHIKNLKIPFILCITKIDKVEKGEKPHPSIKKITGQIATLNISCYTGEGLEEVIEYIKNYSPSNAPKNGRVLSIVSKNIEGLRLLVYSGESILKQNKNIYLSENSIKIRFIQLNTHKKIPIQTLQKYDIAEIVIPVKNIGKDISFVSHTPVKMPIADHGNIIRLNIFPVEEKDLKEMLEAIKIISILDNITMEPIFIPFMGGGASIFVNGPMYSSILLERLKSEFNLNCVIHNTRSKYIVDGVETYSVTEKIKQVQEMYFPVEFKGLTHVFKELLIKNRILIETIDKDNIKGLIPLSSLDENFINNLLSITSGYVEMNYDITKPEYIDIEYSVITFSIHNSQLDSFTEIVPELYAEKKISDIVNLLYVACERQPFAYSVRGYKNNRCIKSLTIKNFAKDVTAHLYGGDVTRKQKLLKKQAKGRAKIKSSTDVKLSRKSYIQGVIKSKRPGKL